MLRARKRADTVEGGPDFEGFSPWSAKLVLLDVRGVASDRGSVRVPHSVTSGWDVEVRSA